MRFAENKPLGLMPRLEETLRRPCGAVKTHPQRRRNLGAGAKFDFGLAEFFTRSQNSHPKQEPSENSTVFLRLYVFGRCFDDRSHSIGWHL